MRCNNEIINITRSDGIVENVRLLNLYNFGFSEWSEIHRYYQHRAGATRDAVMSRLQELFDKVSRLEGTPRRNVFRPDPKPKEKKVG